MGSRRADIERGIGRKRPTAGEAGINFIWIGATRQCLRSSADSAFTRAAGTSVPREGRWINVMALYRNAARGAFRGPPPRSPQAEHRAKHAANVHLRTQRERVDASFIDNAS
jgi:hypothetical protein